MFDLIYYNLFYDMVASVSELEYSYFRWSTFFSLFAQ